MQGMRAALTERSNMILSQSSFAPFPTIGTAMILVFLNSKPLRMSKIVPWGTKSQGSPLLTEGDNFLRMCLSPYFILLGFLGFIYLVIVFSFAAKIVSIGFSPCLLALLLAFWIRFSPDFI